MTTPPTTRPAVAREAPLTDDEIIAVRAPLKRFARKKRRCTWLNPSCYARLYDRHACTCSAADRMAP